MEARAVLNIPGYRENKVRSLLFKNARLEIQLKEERDKVVRRPTKAAAALEPSIQGSKHGTSTPWRSNS